MKHTFIALTGDGEPEIGYKDVTLGRYEPVERKY
jgi:hypothetical protein